MGGRHTVFRRHGFPIVACGQAGLARPTESVADPRKPPAPSPNSTTTLSDDELAVAMSSTPDSAHRTRETTKQTIRDVM